MKCIAVVLAGTLLVPLVALHAAHPPNIVLIVADDLGYADVLFNPHHPREVTTPHLDALAKAGVICHQGYVSGHVCSPTRAGLMTGRYQQRLGLYSGGEAGSGLPMDEKIFPQFLKPAGYATAQFGKWHLGPTLEWSPAHRGFDEVFGFLGRGAHDYFKLDDPIDPIYRGTNAVLETGYLTDRLGEEAAAFIVRQRGRPFFAYLAFNAVHAPLQAPADEIARFNTGDRNRDTLLAMGKRMDDAIGRIVATLKREGAWDNTLLFFISDNGGPLAQTANNAPLRGGKHQDYEGGIRVPFLVCWPAQLRPGETEAVVSSLDILPTALAAAGLSPPTDKPFDGLNLLPILLGEKPAAGRDLYWCSGSDDGWWAVRSGDWKLVGQRAQVELFDLGKDVSEKSDLGRAMPEKLAALTELHDAWLAQMARPVKAGEKKWAPGMSTIKKRKLAPEQRRKAREAERAKRREEKTRAAQEHAAAAPALPDWFESNRVQAHYENRIEEDLAGLYPALHEAVRGMGAAVLTRIFKTVGEGAWWPTEVGRSHEALQGRDLAGEIVRDAHGRGLKLFAYYRVMCENSIEQEHPDWLCRDGNGKLVVEPRTRRRPQPLHVLCLNSPARDHVKRRLVELADRGVDGIYFDSWHMPEICACEHCRTAFEKETGKPMEPSAKRGSEHYRQIAAFVGRTIVRTFEEWKTAVRAAHPGVLFAIGSSLYPCFDTQMQITADLLAISDTSKTEFSKPFGGFLLNVAEAGVEAARRGRNFMEATFALPAYDVQNALGWSLTRDSCDGRPPLMWIPFTRTEEEALFSVAAAVSYGCIASLHPEGLRTSPRSTDIVAESTKVYGPCYELGARMSPALAGARPLRHLLIHVSARSRDARIADPQALWMELFAPILGAFESCKEAHLPVATIDDRGLEHGVPQETRVLILPREAECSDAQKKAIARFETAGGRVIRLESGTGWHLKAEKPRLKQKLLDCLESDTFPIRIQGPKEMHAVFFRGPQTGRTIVCLVNAFGWFHSTREGAQPSGPAPPPCRGVFLETRTNPGTIPVVRELVGGTNLNPVEAGGRTRFEVPPFPVAACIVVEPVGH